MYSTCTCIRTYVCVFEFYLVFLFLKQILNWATIMPISKAMWI